MMKQTVKIKNPSGLHARPAAGFVQKASEFPCNIRLVKGDKQGNAKSIMSILSLGVGQNEQVTIITEGEREAEAMQTLVAFLESLVD